MDYLNHHDALVVSSLNDPKFRRSIYLLASICAPLPVALYLSSEAGAAGRDSSDHSVKISSGTSLTKI